MAKGKKLTAEKAAAEISNMLAEGTASSAEDAVKQRPELEPGLTQFESNSTPVSHGSGPPLLDRDW